MSLSKDNWPIPTEQEWLDYLANQLERANAGMKPESPLEANQRGQQEATKRFIEANPLLASVPDFYALWRDK